MAADIVIAVTGEGNTDYGKLDYNSRKKTNEWKWGPIANYIEKIVGKKITDGRSVELVPIDRHDIDRPSSFRRAQSGTGKELSARRFLFLMQEKGLKYGIYYCDTDKQTGTKNDRHSAEKENNQVHDEVQKGLEDDEITAIPMVPLRMIESWILGDIDAIEKSLEISIPAKKRPDDPEMLWGAQDDPNSNFPKNYLKRMIRNSDKKCKDYEASQDDFVIFAENADIEVMREKCSISFERFCKEFEEMLEMV